MDIHLFDDADSIAKAANELLRLVASGQPSPQSLRDAPLLADWTVCGTQVPALTGHAIGHPVLGDRLIVTSRLLAIDAEARWAQSASRYYRLGPHSVGGRRG